MRSRRRVKFARYSANEVWTLKYTPVEGKKKRLLPAVFRVRRVGLKVEHGTWEFGAYEDASNFVVDQLFMRGFTEIPYPYYYRRFEEIETRHDLPHKPVFYAYAIMTEQGDFANEQSSQTLRELERVFEGGPEQGNGGGYDTVALGGEG